MTTTYQLALFCRYDLEFELDWRRRGAEEALLAALREGKPMHEAIEDALADAEISSLELNPEPESLEIDAGGYNQSTGERSLCFTFRYQFFGEEQLWHMDPGGARAYVDGEIFRYRLILAILAHTPTEAERCLKGRLAKILASMAAQSEKIREFEDGLPRHLESHAKAYGRFKNLLN